MKGAVYRWRRANTDSQSTRVCEYSTSQTRVQPCLILLEEIALLTALQSHILHVALLYPVMKISCFSDNQEPVYPNLTLKEEKGF